MSSISASLLPFSLSHTYTLSLNPYLLFWPVSLRMFPLSFIPSCLSSPFVFLPSHSFFPHSFSCKSFFLSSFIFNLSLANFYEKFLSLSIPPPSFVLTSSQTLFPSLSSACHLSLVSSRPALLPSLPPSPSLYSPSSSDYLYFPLSNTRTIFASQLAPSSPPFRPARRVS